MIEPTQVIKFSERLALYSCLRRFYFPTEPPSTLVASLLPLVILFSRSFLTPVAASRRFYFSLDTAMRHPSSTPDLSFFFLFAASLLVFVASINHGPFMNGARSNDSLWIFIASRVAIYFTSLRRYRKLFAALRPCRPPRQIGRIRART